MTSPKQGSLPGKLNTFQQTMLQWDELHPYNAVHAVRIPATLDPARLRAAIEGVLQYHGLTNLRLEPELGRYAYDGGQTACEIKPAGPFVAEAEGLREEIERQLNTRFDFSRPFNPFRFFLGPASASFWLGLAYFHPVADAESVVRLLKAMVKAYIDNPVVLGEKMDLYPTAKDGWLRNPAVTARKLFSAPTLVRNLRSSCRPPYRNPQDLTNGFEYFTLSAEALQSLLDQAKLWEVTLNDLFLALLIQALSPLASNRARNQKRPNLSVGCIVNTRRDHGLEGERVFGLFLGSFILTQPAVEEIGLRELTAAIRKKTQAIKRDKLYLGRIELAIGRRLLPLFSTERRKKLYQKHYPLWGGITNMNLNSLWEASSDPDRFDYFRAVCTGPVTPFVLSVTTVNQTVNIGVTYRKTVFDAKDVAHIKSLILDRIEQLNRK